MRKPGFTLLELVMVVVIIGILAAIALPNFGPTREDVFNREAQANLRLIAAAERISRMESNNNQYVNCPGVNATGTASVNTNLRLAIPTTNPNWFYNVTAYANGSFCAQAMRNRASVRYWLMNSPSAGSEDPQPQGPASSGCP